MNYNYKDKNKAKQILQLQKISIIERTIKKIEKMSYYDPLAPSFEATRMQIQRTIMGLQQRLLRRRQLDIEIQKDQIQKQNLDRIRRQDYFYSALNHGYNVERQLQQKLIISRAVQARQRQAVIARTVNQLQRQSLQQDYLARLRAIQKQHALLAQQLQIQRQYQLTYKNKYQLDDNYYPLDQSGQTLARKYYDGTKAHQYNQELKRSGQKDNNQSNKNKGFIKSSNNKKLFQQTMNKMNKQKQPDHSTVKKYQTSSNKYQTSSHKYQTSSKKYPQYQDQKDFINNQSPIKQIQNSKFNSTAGKIIKINKQKQQDQIIKNPIFKQPYQFMPHLKAKNLSRSRIKSTQPGTNQLITVSQNLTNQLDSSNRPKSTTKNSRYLSNKHKSSKSLHHYSQQHHYSLERSRLSQTNPNLSVQKKFQAWFKERIRMADGSQQSLDIFYAKDLPEYMGLVFDKQNKLRRQLRDKICNIPIVQRKYNVGPVLQ